MKFFGNMAEMSERGFRPRGHLSRLPWNSHRTASGVASAATHKFSLMPQEIQCAATDWTPPKKPTLIPPFHTKRSTEQNFRQDSLIIC